MREKALLLVVGVFLCGLVAGCGGGSTAGEVAESYGLLNNWDLQPRIAEVIESGQADKMIEDGHAKVRNRVNGVGSSRVLVTEFLIHGEVYRVEVRRAFNPMQNVPSFQVRFGEAKQGFESKIISWLNLAGVLDALQNNSYEARAEVAYRAWKGTDGTVHGVTVRPGLKPEWQPSPKPLDLFIRTKSWPIPEMWFRGLTTDGRRSSLKRGDCNYDFESQIPIRHSKSEFSCDGRWYIMNPGPAGFTGTEVLPFVNLELYNAIGGF